MTKTKAGKPLIKFKNLEIVFTNLDNSTEVFDRLLIIPPKDVGKQSVVLIKDMNIPTRIIAIKDKNKLAKIFKKFGKNINISDIDSIENEIGKLVGTANEDIVTKLNLFIM